MPYWTTQDRPAGEQFTYWREVICEAFTPLATQRRSTHRPPGPREVGIESWVRSSPLGRSNCAEVSSRTQLISHGPAEVRRTVDEHVFINLQLAGHCLTGQDGRQCVVRAGEFTLVDTTREYQLEFVEDPVAQEWRVLSFRVPRQALVTLLPSTGFTAVTHHTGSKGPANLAASTMVSIWNNLDGLDDRSAESAEAAFRTVLAASIGGHEPPRDSRHTLDAAMRAAVNRYLAENVRTATLSATAVARHFAVSVRKLHSLYERTEQTFAQTVMTYRVEGCVRDLSIGGDGPTMTELAARWGFYDLSHLNRVFRSQQGRLPSEYRDHIRSSGRSSLLRGAAV